jgi:signal transduction histidine kinase
MGHSATKQRQQNHSQSILQAFTCLLTMVDALASITDQEEKALRLGAENAAPLALAAAGQTFAEIAKQMLDCAYVGVFALDPPDERQRLLGVSGLNFEERQKLFEDTNQTPLAQYVDTETIAHLHANKAVLLDLQKKPFVTTRSTHGARYRLVAPMVHHGALIGIFTMAKTDAIYPDVESAYTPEEISLAQGIAKLATQVIERVDLLRERAEARANEQRLHETARRYDDFLSTASHELRTPLTTIKGHLQLAQRRAAILEKRAEQLPQALAEDVHRIVQSLEHAVRSFPRLERMISELLDFSRIQASKFVMIKYPCDLAEIISRAVEEARHAACERQISLSLPAGKAVPIIADADRIGEVIDNYLSNAHKYSPLDHPIEVNLTVEGRLACVSVRDHGPGISPEDQMRIWERFYRAPDIVTQDQCTADSNLGLGLYLCKEIIELHHGQYGVDSVKGEGSTFWFTLEIAEQ